MGRARGAARRVLAVWCPDWPPGTPDSGPEARGFEQVVAAVEEFCPRVEVVRPGMCAVGATGPARYFGGEESLARKITDAVTALGFACRAGVADSLFAAQLAAQVPGLAPGLASGPAPGSAHAAAPGPARTGAPGRAGLPGLIVAPGGTRAFLAPYPVSVLDVPEFADLLPRLGIWTLGDFARLPAAEAANRFGAPGKRARGLACVRVQVQATCADGQDITRLWRHAGILSALAVAERVRWQLDGWRAGRDPDERSPGETALTGGITRLRLVP